MTPASAPRRRGFPWRVIPPLVILLLFAVLAKWRPDWLARVGLDPRGAASIPIAGGDFVLQGEHGPWRLAEQARDRRLVLLYFGFTRCPDLCPTTLATLRRDLDRLRPDERRQVLVVFVSVDHRTDRPAEVAEYARYFAPDFVGITGDSAAIERVCRQYDVFHAFTPLPGSQMGYTVDHTTQVYLVKPTGEVLDHVGLDREGVDFPAMLRRNLRR